MASSIPPPPPDDRIRYKRRDDFVFCRQCFTHLALIGLREGESRNAVLVQNHWVLFKDAVNLRLDQEHEITEGATIVRAYCKNCGAFSGFKLMSLTVQDDILREGTYFLNGLKMLVRSDNKMWFGHTPVVIEYITLTDIAEHFLNFTT